MPILKNIKINLTVEALLDQGLQVKYTSKIEKEVTTAIDLSKQLLQPKVAYQWVEVLDVQNGRIVCYNYQSNKINEFVVGAIDSLLAEAKFILVSISTIVSKLDESILALNQSGNYLMAYLLDHIGVIALEQINTVVCSLAEKKAQNRGWGVSPFISPGAFEGWELEGQKTLFELVPFDKIGVHLNPAGMMSPLKSVSGIIAIGPGFASGKVAPLCSTCNHVLVCKKHNREKTKEVIS